MVTGHHCSCWSDLLRIDQNAPQKGLEVTMKGNILLVYAYYGEHPVVVVVEEELFRG